MDLDFVSNALVMARKRVDQQKRLLNGHRIALAAAVEKNMPALAARMRAAIKRYEKVVEATEKEILELEQMYTQDNRQLDLTKTADSSEVSHSDRRKR